MSVDVNKVAFGEWNPIKSQDDLPSEQGYYLVAIEIKDFKTEEKYYDTDYVFFRGKTT